MDFPKKQAQRLMPLYLLEYSEKLFTNHPDPSAPWGGGGGSDYTAGQGITITNNEISVDTNVIATKSDIAQMVTTTQLNDALDDYALKTEIPTEVSQLTNDAGYATETWVQNQGYLPSDSLRDVYKAEVEISQGQNKVFPHYSGIEYSKEFEDKRLTIKLEDIDNGNHPTIMLSEHERTYIYPGHVDTVSSDNQNSTQMDFNEFRVSTDGGMNLTRFRKGGIDYNNIYFNLNSNKTTLENYTLATLDDIPSLDGYATEWWVNHQGFISSTDLSNYVTSSQLSNALSPINSNITDLQTLTSTHTSQISAINSSITSLESLVNTNTSNISTIQNNISTISSSITTLEELTSTHTSQISALQTSVSNCVTLSQLSTTLSDYALKSEVPSYSLSTTSTPVLSSATLSQSYETLTFTYSDNTTASFNFLTTGTTLSTSTVNVFDSTTLS